MAVSAFLLAFISTVITLSTAKTVSLDYGSFTAAETDTYFAFKGVKYADAPTGALRWKRPVSPPSTNLGHINATQLGNACISGTSNTTQSGQSEDCLFGNIYVPLITSAEKLPVMIWFHGGGYRQGQGDADPQALFKASAKPFIFAAFNYRLAQFGFLGGSRIHSNGVLNAGLEDQRAAMRWVHKYIEKFGGDPTKVTLWGQSAGAGSVMFHLLANGGEHQALFRAAMADSPPLTFTPKYTDDYVEDIFQTFTNEAGCGEATDALACLRDTKIDTLITAGPKTAASHPDTIYLFAPVFGGFFSSQPPIESFRAGTFAKVPLLAGSNTDDGFGWSAQVTDPAGNTSTPGSTEETVFTFIKGQYAYLDKDTFNQLVAVYPLSAYQNSVDLQAQQMYGENRFICNAAQMTGSEHGAHQRAYHYRYNATDARHAAELTALLATTDSGDAEQDRMILQMRQYWTSFVTDGVPTAKGGINWAQVTDSMGNHRLVFTPGAVGFEDMSEQLGRCNLWQTVGLKMGI